MNWISVKEKMPNPGQRVLMFGPCFDFGAGFFCDIGFHNWVDRYNWNMDDNEWRADITHWMPLPEPPEAKCRPLKRHSY